MLLDGVGISNLGDFIYIVAINLMVLNMTHSPAAVSFAGSALILMFLPKLGIGEQNKGSGGRLTPRIIAQDWKAVLSFSRQSGYVVGTYALFQIILVIGMSLDAQEVVFIRQRPNRTVAHTYSVITTDSA